MDLQLSMMRAYPVDFCTAYPGTLAEIRPVGEHCANLPDDFRRSTDTETIGYRQQISA
jgi:hypothetical protein